MRSSFHLSIYRSIDLWKKSSLWAISFALMILHFFPIPLCSPLHSPILSSFSLKLSFPSLASGDRCKLRQTVYPLKISCTSRGIQYHSLLSALFLSTWIELSVSHCIRVWRRTKSDWAVCLPLLSHWAWMNVFRLDFALFVMMKMYYVLLVFWNSRGHTKT